MRLPKIKKRVKDFLFNEAGRINKQPAVSIGAFLMGAAAVGLSGCGGGGGGGATCVECYCAGDSCDKSVSPGWKGVCEVGVKNPSESGYKESEVYATDDENCFDNAYKAKAGVNPSQLINNNYLKDSSGNPITDTAPDKPLEPLRVCLGGNNKNDDTNPWHFNGTQHFLEEDSQFAKLSAKHYHHGSHNNF